MIKKAASSYRRNASCEITLKMQRNAGFLEVSITDTEQLKKTALNSENKIMPS